MKINGTKENPTSISINLHPGADSYVNLRTEAGVDSKPDQPYVVMQIGGNREDVTVFLDVDQFVAFAQAVREHERTLNEGLKDLTNAAGRV